MPRKLILFALGIVAVAVIGVVAWRIVPGQLAAREKLQACQAVYDQMRREIDTPAEADFPDCESALILPGEDGGWVVHGEYKIPRPGFTNPYRFMFYGNAWRAAGEWEAAIVTSGRVLP